MHIMKTLTSSKLDHQIMYCTTIIGATLKCFPNELSSSEQAYQWRFIKYIGMDDLAGEILAAQTPAEAKEITSRVSRHLHGDWYNIKHCVMKDILHTKADYCSKFRTTLMNTVGMRLVESTRDLYWASGLLP